MEAAVVEDVGRRQVVRAPLGEALHAAEEGTLVSLAAVRDALRHAVGTVKSVSG